MTLHLRAPQTLGTRPLALRFPLPPSKSLLARQLILCTITRQPLPHLEQPLPEDITALTEALESLQQGCTTIDVWESGTAMRLMCALLAASTTQSVRLIGRGRQHNRPIAPLVEALRQLGGCISYLEQEGYPPLEIQPAHLQARTITLDASQSSQFLSALLLIAPLLNQPSAYRIDTRPNGIASAPYAEMTLQVMQRAGFHWEHHQGLYSYRNETPTSLSLLDQIESDWTAASYGYLIGLIMQQRLEMQGLRIPSLQGDAEALEQLLAQLKREQGILTHHCSHCPDLVPSLLAMYLWQRRPFCLEGVGHLRLKESDRLEALCKECKQLGVRLRSEGDSLSWVGGEVAFDSSLPLRLNPHGDHRIAMALAPLMAGLCPEGVIVAEAEVVEKSFPSYWANLKALGWSVQTQA